MNEETRKLLESLAASLHTTADHLWQVMIRQAYVSFWTDILFYVIATTIISYCVKYSAKLWEKGNQCEYDEAEWKLGSAGVLLLGGIFLLISICSIEETFTKVINPEYWAFHEVLKAFSK